MTPIVNQATATALGAALKTSTSFNKIVARTSSTAEDENGFVVTEGTADTYELVKFQRSGQGAAVLT